MKKTALLLAFVMFILSLFCSCEKDKQRFSESFIDYFDTVATVSGFADSREEFDAVSERVEESLSKYHELYDIYNSYSGINNIKTINDNSGLSPVKVDAEIVNLLTFAEEIYNETKGKTDVTMGAMLGIWHSYRTEGINDPENARLPSEDELSYAAMLRGFDKIVINHDEGTVFITEKGLKLDVGAVAKGYATEMIARSLEAEGVTGYALNIGGNIRVLGNKADGEKWTASVTDPEGNGSLMKIDMNKASFVTSGSYIRYYTVDGIRYHHIIDPETCFPKNEFSAVAVLSNHSGRADAISTALFNLSYEEGLALVASIPDTEAVWIRADGEILYSENFAESIIKE